MTHLVRKLLVLSATVAATLVSVAASALAQEGGSISGRAIDATTSAPIPSAQVQIIGTGRGGTTADDGRFRIANVRPGTYQVRVLRIGYQASTQPVTLGPGQAITLEYSLAPAVVTLDEVVTLATGATTRKREQGMVVGTLTPEPAALATAGNITQLLTGRIPGVDVASPGGTIGSSARTRIRGASSLSLSNDPLLVVDGIRVENSSASTTIGVGGQQPSRFNDINPEDIEKIDILKGPAAAALYGTAAANGVIQITTKHGRTGTTRFTSLASRAASRTLRRSRETMRGSDLRPLLLPPWEREPRTATSTTRRVGSARPIPTLSSALARWRNTVHLSTDSVGPTE